MCYKILNNLIYINFNDHFTVRTSSSILTRSSLPSLLKPFCRTNRTENNFLFRSSDVSTALPVTITNAPSSFEFKRRLSNFDLQTYLFGQFYKQFLNLLLTFCILSQKIRFIIYIALHILIMFTTEYALLVIFSCFRDLN